MTRSNQFEVQVGQRGFPLPPDAPLLTFAEAGAYLRLSAAAVRKLLNGRPDGPEDELGALLRSWMVRLSPRRRYILREPFLQWLREKADAGRKQD